MANKSEEQKLRIFIRNYLSEALSKKIKEDKDVNNSENTLRIAIRKLLQEKESVVPGASTGINELESVLTSIIPAIESDYKKLTTSNEQRKSYRAHIIRAAIDILLAADAAFSANEEQEGTSETEPAEQSLQEQENKEDIDIKIGDQTSPKPGDEQKLIDVETEGAEEEESKEKELEELDAESFGIPGQDLTGRNIALRTWNKRGIGTTIKNGYKLLENPRDRKIFFDYLLTNLKLYFDRFEKDLQGTVQEPTTSAYEKIKQSGQSYETEGGGGSDVPAQTSLQENKRNRLVSSNKLSDQILAHLLR